MIITREIIRTLRLIFVIMNESLNHYAHVLIYLNVLNVKKKAITTEIQRLISRFFTI